MKKEKQLLGFGVSLNNGLSMNIFSKERKNSFEYSLSQDVDVKQALKLDRNGRLHICRDLIETCPEMVESVIVMCAMETFKKIKKRDIRVLFTKIKDSYVIWVQLNMKESKDSGEFEGKLLAKMQYLLSDSQLKIIPVYLDSTAGNKTGFTTGQVTEKRHQMFIENFALKKKSIVEDFNLNGVTESDVVLMEDNAKLIVIFHPDILKENEDMQNILSKICSSLVDRMSACGVFYKLRIVIGKEGIKEEFPIKTLHQKLLYFYKSKYGKRERGLIRVSPLHNTNKLFVHSSNLVAPMKIHTNIPENINVDDIKSIDTFQAYGVLADVVAKYPNTGNNLIYTALGLGGESGEVLEKLKKISRRVETLKLADITPEEREAVAKELGDVLWYLHRTCVEMGTTLSSVATENIKKLHNRLKEGTLYGNGDNR